MHRRNGYLVAWLLVLLAGPDRVVRTRDAHPVAVSVLAVAGIALLVAAAGFALTDQVATVPPDRLGTRRLFAAYAGSAAGIAGTDCLVMTFLLVTAHAVVPRRGDEGRTAPPAISPTDSRSSAAARRHRTGTGRRAAAVSRRPASHRPR